MSLVAKNQLFLAGILASEAQIRLRMSAVCFVHLWLDALFVRLDGAGWPARERSWGWCVLC